MRRESDNAPYVGLRCVCGQLVKLSEQSGVFVGYPEPKAFHWPCWYAGPGKRWA